MVRLDGELVGAVGVDEKCLIELEELFLRGIQGLPSAILHVECACEPDLSVDREDGGAAFVVNIVVTPDGNQALLDGVSGHERLRARGQGYTTGP